MRIAVIASLTPNTTITHTLRAMRRQGHQLLVVSDVAHDLADVVCSPTPDVAVLCAQRNFVPDWLLFAEGGTMQLFPTGLERLPVPTAWYAIDTHMDYAKHVRISRCFDVTFVVHKQFVDDLKADGIVNAHWLTVAFPADLQPETVPERNIDLAFVGSVNPQVHPDRARTLDALARIVPQSAFGMAPAEEMIARYMQARMVYNKSVRNDINMRYFEAMGAGAVLLTNPLTDDTGVNDLFRPGEHYLTYESDDHLQALVRELLAQPDRVTAMGNAARQLILDHHTYDHRVAEMIAIMHNSPKRVMPTASDYFGALVHANMGAEALTQAALALGQMGRQTGLAPLNRLFGQALQLLAAAYAGLRQVGRRVKGR